MTSPTDPTVPLPTSTDTDDDDDDDDLISSLLPAQPPAATPTAQTSVNPAPAPPAATGVPGISSAGPAPTAATVPANPSASGPAGASSTLPSSATGPAGGNPSASSNAASDGNDGGGGLSAGASAGIGVGVALLVCLAAFGAWFLLRRRRARRVKTLAASSNVSDEERAQTLPKTEVYAYHANGPAEVSGDEKPRRYSELESPTYIAEASDGHVFRAELPGSAVPVAAVAGKRRDERLFVDAPIDEADEPMHVQERTVDKKNDERLFSDPPIDEGTDTLNTESRPLKKG